MKIAYIILAYKNPIQLRILVEHLTHPNHFFFIHIDKRIDITPFRKQLKGFEGRIIWVKREKSYWGSYYCVKAMINGLKQSINYKNIRFDYFIHLSGQDFPLKSPDFINQTLFQNSPVNFVNLIPFPVRTWENGGIDRIRNLKFFWEGNRIIIHSGVKNWVLKSLYSLTNVLFRFLDKNKKFYGGEFYFMLHRSGVERLLSNIEKNPLFFNRLKYVTLPEEIIIHTMISNFDHINFDYYHPDKFRMIFWEPNKKNPREMDESEIVNYLDTPFLFGRKFVISNPSFKLQFIK